MAGQGLPAEARFWRMVDRSGGQEACWIWRGAVKMDSPSKRRTGGYGRFKFEGRSIGAHRFALELKVGRALSRHEEAGHQCRNRLCCNPAHLCVEGHAENCASGKRLDWRWAVEFDRQRKHLRDIATEAAA